MCPAHYRYVSCHPPQADEDLPRPEEIEVEFQDLYRHDEEQAYCTLMAQDIKSINFPCEENYTVRLCVSQGRPNTPFWHANSAHSEPSRGHMLTEGAGHLPQPQHTSDGLVRADRIEPHPLG
jgi:hypothetical protein